MIDLYNSDKEGPFTSERAGGIPTLELVDLCFSGKYTKESIVRKLVGGGGLVSYLGTTDAVILEERVRAGDTQTRLILEAMAYQFAKYIGALAAVLEGDVHAVVLTGGMAHSELIVQWIRERVRFIAPILLYPGECEMEALASGVLRVLTGEEEPRVYE
jgi:butyrate kinase